jgi:hypothetical protein
MGYLESRMSGRYPFFTRLFSIVKMLAGALAYIFILSQTRILYYTKPRVSNTFSWIYQDFLSIYSGDSPCHTRFRFASSRFGAVALYIGNARLVVYA